jgi:hypothetical protein
VHFAAINVPGPERVVEKIVEKPVEKIVERVVTKSECCVCPSLHVDRANSAP